MLNQRIASSSKLLTLGRESRTIAGYYLMFKQPTRAREKHFQMLWCRLLYNEPNEACKTRDLIGVAEFVIRL